jgi:hypothetical protein
VTVTVAVAGNFSNKPYLKISINSPKKKNWKILLDTPTEIFIIFLANLVLFLQKNHVFIFERRKKK